MFHKVKTVRPLAEYTLLVDFMTGERKHYYILPLLSRFDTFRTLTQIKGLFEQVKVDAGGYGVSRNDEIDLSCDELYENGVSV
jgi:hypothetical protein